jgi:hypothetical protein
VESYIEAIAQAIKLQIALIPTCDNKEAIYFLKPRSGDDFTLTCVPFGYTS